MRMLALVVALLSVPASAAEYTPWPAHEVVAPSLLFQRVKSSDDGCCKHCTKGQPCGDTCISASAKGDGVTVVARVPSVGPAPPPISVVIPDASASVTIEGVIR